nr:UPF0500 protein C1orf216 homolog [Columba livia]
MALPLSCRQETSEMFAFCVPGAAANAPFRQGQGDPALGTAVPGAGCGQDSNSNFVGEVCDSNENWSRAAPGTPLEESSSRSENTANPSDNLLLLTQRQMAVQHLQDKERFKEREKEKHHIQLVMYRRLALLRWIHGLQQKVVDQQNRLQESFDTILDNRKELIRCMQHGPACPAGAAAPSP